MLVPAQFQPSKLFNFPKPEFGSKGEKISSRAEWCQQFEWLFGVMTQLAMGHGKECDQNKVKELS